MSETWSTAQGPELAGKPIIWELYECDKGSRWAQLKESPVWLKKYDGQPCNFSGCKTGHFVHFVRETGDRHEANTWFRDANDGKEIEL